MDDLLDTQLVDKTCFEVNRSINHVPTAMQEIIEVAQFMAGTETKINVIKIPENVANFRYKFDKNRFQQVLLNLLTNAIKFCVNGSITVNLSFKSGFLCTEVTDDGPGFQEEDIP